MVSLSRSSFRAFKTIIAPIFEHSIAIDFPIPEEAPVTNIVFPSNENGLYINYIFDLMILYKSSIVVELLISSPLTFIPYSSSTIAITDKAIKEDHSSIFLNCIFGENSFMSVSSNCEAKFFTKSVNSIFI